MGNKNNSTPSKPTSLGSIAWPLGVLLLLSTIAIIASLNQANNFKQVSQPATYSETTNKKIIQPNAFFYTKIFQQRDKTNVSFPFKFENEKLTIYLLGQSKQGEYNISRLVYHPSFENLDWEFVSDNTLQLYQKLPTYQNVEEFVANPPTQATILADRQLIALTQYDHINFTEIPDNPGDINLDEIDYIFTTYLPIRVVGDLYNYDQVIDASNMAVNSNNELVWQLFIPNATETNPFYLGEIHVNYQ